MLCVSVYSVMCVLRRGKRGVGASKKGGRDVAIVSSIKDTKEWGIFSQPKNENLNNSLLAIPYRIFCMGHKKRILGTLSSLRIWELLGGGGHALFKEEGTSSSS